MFKVFASHFPSLYFCLANFVFWCMLNTVAADHTHRSKIRWGRTDVWFDTWLEYLPFWMNWALMTPIIVAFTKLVISLDFPRKKLILCNVMVCIVSMTIYWGLTFIEVAFLYSEQLVDWEAIYKSWQKLINSPLHLDFLIYLAVASIGLTMSFYNKAMKHSERNQQLSNQLLNTELQSLKSQLSPHFLFNTLNTISGLVRLEAKDKAVKSLSDLSLMFRKVLENQKTQLTTLRNEMEFVNSYLSIQKMRFETKLVVEMQIRDDSYEAKIPFMLLHTMVENAVQHGSQLESDENLLRLTIRKSGGFLNIKLTNKIAKSGVHKGFGVGLENSRKRLEHIYKDRYSLECRETDDHHFEILLTIPEDITDA